MWIVPLALGVGYLLYGWGWARSRREHDRPLEVLVADGLVGFGFIFYAVIDFYDFWAMEEIAYLLLVVGAVLYFAGQRSR